MEVSEPSIGVSEVGKLYAPKEACLADISEKEKEKKEVSEPAKGVSEGISEAPKAEKLDATKKAFLTDVSVPEK
jgi:hypothetical protein